MDRALRALPAVLVSVFLAAAGCDTTVPSPSGELHWDGVPVRANVVLIVNDTMRRDRLGIYGGPARTPVFDAFAAQNVLFEHAATQAPWTKPSIATLFTSLYPSQHWVFAHPDRSQEVARDRERLRGDARPLRPEARELIARLARYQDGSPVAGLASPATIALLEMAYDRGLEHFDRALGLLLDELRARPEYERTAVIVTSDHGEALFTRGYGGHGRGLYDDEVAIPLAMRLPSVDAKGLRVQALAGLVDVFPTLCRYLGLSCPAEAAGMSLLAAPGERRNETRVLFTEGVMHNPRNRSAYTRAYKLLFEPDYGPNNEIKVHPYALYDDVFSLPDVRVQDGNHL